jgi:hypothetical protein
MKEQHQRPATTEAERLRVLVLAGEGLTEKAIAKEVFGDERYYARVGRILRAIPRRRVPRENEVSDVTWLLADLTVRQWRDFAAGGILPSLDALEEELKARGFAAPAVT